MSAFEQMADLAEARALGAASPEHAWVLTDRDVWHKNPNYQGPEMPHPEDDDAHEFIAEHGIEAWRAEQEAWRAGRAAQPPFIEGGSISFDEIPF